MVHVAVCKLQQNSRASSGRAAFPNNKNKPAALPSFQKTATDEPFRTIEDSGLLSSLISCAVSAGKFAAGKLTMTLVSSTTFLNWSLKMLADLTSVIFAFVH